MGNFPYREPITEKETGLISPRWQVYFRDQQNQIANTPQLATSAVQLTGQTDSITTTPIPSDALAPGTYALSYYMRVTTAAGVSSDATATFSFTDGGVSCAFVGDTMNGNTTNTVQTGTYTFDIDQATPVSYAVAYNSNPANAMVFKLTMALTQVASA